MILTIRGAFPIWGRAVPTWIEIQLPAAGKRGRLSAQVTLGRRIPRSKKAKSSAVLATDMCEAGDSDYSEVEDGMTGREDTHMIGDVSSGDSLARVDDTEGIVLGG